MLSASPSLIKLVRILLWFSATSNASLTNRVAKTIPIVQPVDIISSHWAKENCKSALSNLMHLHRVTSLVDVWASVRKVPMRPLERSCAFHAILSVDHVEMLALTVVSAVKLVYFLFMTRWNALNPVQSNTTLVRVRRDACRTITADLSSLDTNLHKCVRCKPDCATCETSSHVCTSCPDGYALKGTDCLKAQKICQTNEYFDFADNR